MDKTYVSRKPIYESNATVHAYKLIAQPRERSNPLPTAHDLDTLRDDLGTFSEVGLDQIVGNHQAFVNVSREAVIAGYCRSLSKHRVVLEVLPGIVLDPALTDGLSELSRIGYKVAVGNDTLQSLMEPVDRLWISFGSTFVI